MKLLIMIIYISTITKHLLQDLKNSRTAKKIIIIDKHEEQLTDKNDPLANQLDELNYFLETYKCKTRSVVFDNTHDDHFFS